MKLQITKDNLLNQTTLAALENLCVQDESPKCEAQCPLHIEAREFTAAIENDDFALAYKIYAKRAPFPLILANICEAPCQDHCLRKDLGGSIQIQKLEQIVTKIIGKSQKAPPFLPVKNKKIAVVGGGLAGMTLSLELAKKGYSIVIYEKSDTLGGDLNALTATVLSSGALKSSIDYLLSFKNISVEYDTLVDVDSLEAIESLLKDNSADAVFISLDSTLEEKSDSTTKQYADLPIFTNNTGGLDYPYVSSMSNAKSIALTIDRALANVSIMYGREKEGVYETRLYTNTSEILAKESFANLITREDAICEARRCIQCECLECKKACSFMQKIDNYPRKLVRETYNNLSIVMGIRHSNKMIAGCQTCGQCERICPNELSMKDVILAAREIMNEQLKIPPTYYGFALKDLYYSNSEEFFLAKHQPNMNASRYVYFPSCQLSASEPELLIHSYQELTENLEGGVGLLLGCCGVMAQWAGETKVFNESIARLKDELNKLGNPIIITACPTCKQTLSQNLGQSVLGIWEVIKTAPLELKDTRRLTLHDSCGARTDKETQDSVRQLLNSAGYEAVEPHYNKDESACCGYGGLTAFSRPEFARAASENLIKTLDQPTVTYCINCRDLMLKEGAESYHLLELIYPDVAINQKYPTWSKRHANRKLAKNKLLQDFWEENSMPETLLPLVISDDLYAKMEERMILEIDISNTIIAAEKTGNIFKNQKTGAIIASSRIGNVTYWIEYTLLNSEYKIKKAYSHRMAIKN